MTLQTNPWIGQLVSGRYRIRSVLTTEGGMADVYLADDQQTRQTVVVKTPKPALLNEEFLGRFDREMRALTILKHPNIVPIIDSGEHQGMPFFVLKYLPNGTVRSRMLVDANGKPQPVPMDRLVSWLGPVADALDYLHAKNFLHRDIKPGNILFDTDDTPYLCDFGILKMAAGAPNSAGFGTQYTQAGLIIGTPQYMAPELIAPDMLKGQQPDGRADQFSLGVTLYELLAGRLPVPDANPATVFTKLLKKNYPPLEQLLQGLPPALTKAVARATATDRNQRFASCRAFAQAVLASMPGQPRLPDALPADLPAAQLATATPARETINNTPSKPHRTKPTATPAPAAAVIATAEVDDRAAEKTTGSKNQMMLWIIIGACVVVFLLCSGACLFGLLLGKTL